MALITEYVKTLVPINWVTTPSGWTHGNCPMCILNGESRPDTKGRGGIRFDADGESFQYNCFNCGYKTWWSPGSGFHPRIKRLLMQFGADESDVQRLQLELMQEDQVAELLNKKQRKKQPIQLDWPEFPLPSGAEPIHSYTGEATPEFVQVIEYITARGLDVMSNDFWYTPAKIPAKMNNRFIIPFFYNGKIVGYNSRWASKQPLQTSKYYKQAPLKNFVYGLDKQTSDKRIVIVTEGELDAIITDGVAIGSNKCNTEQADIIDSLNKRVILLPDADKASMSLIDTAIERGWYVAFPEWDNCKDAGDALMKYGRLATMRSIIDSAVSNKMKIKILTKQYCR